MTDESQLLVRPKDGDSSLSISKARSGLIARGRRDAAILTAPVRAEPEWPRTVYYTGSVDDRPIEEVRKDAERGDAKMQSRLAYKYLRQGPEQDLAESARWYRKAAEQGYTTAQFNLGVMYDKGEGVTQDYVEAAKWYRAAADQGYTTAQFNLGVMYHKGEGVTQDYVEAAKWWSFALKRKYRALADQGNRDAQFKLGVMYDGQGVAQDFVESLRWYRKAAYQGGFEPALFNLGVKYNNGQGVPKDYVVALMYYDFLLTYRHPFPEGRERRTKARDDVAKKLTPQQLAESQRMVLEYAWVDYIRRAAEIGYAGAQFDHGVSYYKGQGVPQDYEEGVIWCRRAAEQGHADAQSILGAAYEKGEGVPQDYVQAHLWSNLAAAHYPASETEHRNSAVSHRDQLARKMTPEQLTEAQRLAREWKQKSRVSCFS